MCWGFVGTDICGGDKVDMCKMSYSKPQVLFKTFSSQEIGYLALEIFFFSFHSFGVVL